MPGVVPGQEDDPTRKLLPAMSALLVLVLSLTACGANGVAAPGAPTPTADDTTWFPTTPGVLLPQPPVPSVTDPRTPEDLQPEDIGLPTCLGAVCRSRSVAAVISQPPPASSPLITELETGGAPRCG